MLWNRWSHKRGTSLLKLLIISFANKIKKDMYNFYLTIFFHVYWARNSAIDALSKEESQLQKENWKALEDMDGSILEFSYSPFHEIKKQYNFHLY